MKTCQECGEQVNDNVLTCPNCGATVVMHVTGLSLKGEGKPAKKKTNPMGMSVGASSGLTDILRSSGPADFDEGDLYGGATPVVLTKEKMEENASYTNKKKDKVFSKVFKIIFWIAVLYGVYLLASKMLAEANKKQSRDEAFDMYMAAVASPDAEVPKDLVAPYEKHYDLLNSPHIKFRNERSMISSKVLSTNYYTEGEIDKLNTKVKLAIGENAKIKEACVIELEYVANNSRIYTEKLTFVRIKNCWYLDSGAYTDDTEDD